ncbi:MAG: butyrate kinase [Parasporobacterium sp.]|nr:butyrate kinase [Parasporobacterium sp.]
MYTILVINPGSTSTKIAVYRDEEAVLTHTFKHTGEEFAGCKAITDQTPIRAKLILDYLAEQKIDLKELSCVMSRGGMLPPIETGGYLVNEEMKDTLINRPSNIHASNVGALIADQIAKPLGIPAYIYDAVVAGELPPEAKVTGFPEFERQSFAHILNGRAMSRKAAAQLGKTFEECNFVVAHLGGGISVAAYKKGKMIDTVAADAGPFSPERSGSINLMYLVDLCFTEGMTKEKVMKKVNGGGGMKAHLGTADLVEVGKRIVAGDEHAKLIFDAMALQICKGIGTLLAIFDEPVDAVILTGGLAHSEHLIEGISRRVSNIAKIIVLPGENEMESLAEGALRILKGEEEAKIFKDNR